MFPFYKKPCAVFRTVNCIDCSDLCIFLSYGSRMLNCNLFFDWLRLEEKGLSGTARLCMRFQSTRLKEVVAQLQKAQLLQSKGRCVDAAL